jgi:hypothetical protein
MDGCGGEDGVDRSDLGAEAVVAAAAVASADAHELQRQAALLHQITEVSPGQPSLGAEEMPVMSH